MDDNIYVKINFDIGYYVGDSEFCCEYPSGTSDLMIENDVQERFYQYCDDYSYLLTAGFDESLESEWEKEWENALDQCSWSWEKISKEEYDEYCD